MPKDAEISEMYKRKTMAAKEEARKLNVVLLTVSKFTKLCPFSF